MARRGGSPLKIPGSHPNTADMTARSHPKGTNLGEVPNTARMPLARDSTGLLPRPGREYPTGRENESHQIQASGSCCQPLTALDAP